MEPAPLELELTKLAPVLTKITADKGVSEFFLKLGQRDPPVVTVAELRDNLTWHVLKALSVGVMQLASLGTLSRLLEPNDPFQWANPRHAVYCLTTVTRPNPALAN
jgi:hypothetical protein